MHASKLAQTEFITLHNLMEVPSALEDLENCAFRVNLSIVVLVHLELGENEKTL
jgi:hypothetical protein